MAKSLVAPVGISGAGKSTLYLNYFQDYIRICPDDLRRAITGDVSNQSRNREVFAAAYYMLNVLLQPANARVFFDATNLDGRAVEALKKAADDHDATLAFVLMTDSENLKICSDRVAGDISSGKDRANTLVVDDILPKQQGKYFAIVPYIKALEKKFSNISIKTFNGKDLK